MDLLSKFNQVEVKAESRIDAEDKKFCEVNSVAYDKAIFALLKMSKFADEFVAEQRNILSAIYSEDQLQYSTKTYIGDKGFSSDKYLDQIISAHRYFINKIVSYFESKYHVTLVEDKIVDILIPEKPEFHGTRIFVSKMSDDEMDEYKKQLSEHKKLVVQYNQSIYELRISYSDILDHIFAQLGGFSFQDKAVNELKAAAHRAAWNIYHGKKEFEQKKAVVTFSGYFCHWDAWYSGPHIELSSNMKKIILALMHFEFGDFEDHRTYGFNQLLSYSFDCNEYCMDYLEKVKSVKCFKNGRVDLRFQSEAYARQFIEDYLGLVA